ncbi:uncharacterized protein [Palaemon carinicauda]|uniref:uncharacterized protein isoform X2 n=1 Tax=Palaemon carinicauda TaxID=392227 RepID=UPI0035B6990E
MRISVEYDENYDQPSGSKTWKAIKAFFRPVKKYFKTLPEKTPSDVAVDVEKKAIDWVIGQKETVDQFNETISQWFLRIGDWTTVNRDWLREKATFLQDKTFQEMYDDVMTRVLSLNELWSVQGQQHRNNLVEDEAFEF